MEMNNATKTQIEALLEQERYAEVQAILDTYCDQYVYDEEVASIASILFLAKGNYEEALRCIEYGFHYNSNSGDLYYNLGNIYEQLNQAEAAILCYRAAIDLIQEEDTRQYIEQLVTQLQHNHTIVLTEYSVITVHGAENDSKKIVEDAIVNQKDCLFIQEGSIILPRTILHMRLHALLDSEQPIWQTLRRNITACTQKNQADYMMDYYTHILEDSNIYQCDAVTCQDSNREELTKNCFFVKNFYLMKFLEGEWTKGQVAICKDCIVGNIISEVNDAADVKKPMVIDIVLATISGYGGTEIVIEKVAKGLVKSGHRVRVILLIDADCAEWTERLPEYYYYYEHTDMRENMEDFIAAYSGILDRIGNPDMMLATTRLAMVPTCKMVGQARGISVPVITWFHVTLRSKTADLYKQYLPYADAHLAISTAMYDDLERLAGTGEIYLVNNPVTMSNVPMAVRNEGSDELQLLFIGRICIEKRLDIVLAALSMVQGKWHLQIIGDGELREELEQFTVKIGIQKHITWTGWVSNPWDYVQEAAILVQPSDYEGFCMTAVEGLLRGIPVAITNIPGPRDYMVDGKNGWLLQKNDPIGLAQLLNGIISEKVQLPSPEICRSSVLQYEEENVIRNIETALLTIKRNMKIRGMECDRRSIKTD